MSAVGREHFPRARRICSLTAAAPRRLAAHLARYWALWVAFACVGAAAALGLHTGLERLFHRWNYAYNHSFLVLPMAAWLLMIGLRGVTIGRVGPSVPGFLVLVGAVVLYALSETLDFTLGMQASLPIILYGGVMALAGVQFAWYAAIPAAMLYFTIPVWDLTVGPLQDISTWVVTAWLRWSGVTAHIDGYFITLRVGVFEIAEGCSGMRYVVIGLALAAFYSFCWLRRWRTRLLLLAVAGFASMLANWVRIYTLILIGDWTAMEHYLIAESHDGYGWVVFMLFMAPVLWLARWLEWREPPVPQSARGPATVKRVAPALVILLAGSLVAAAVASPMTIRGGVEAPAEPLRITLISEPAAGWEAGQVSHNWKPRYEAPHIVGHEGYVSSGGDRIDVYMARYLSQQPDSKLMARSNTLSPGWQSRATRDTQVSVNGDSRRVRVTELGSGGARRLLWSWYLVGGRPVYQDVRAKLLEVPALLTGRRDGAVIAVSAMCHEGCDTAEAAIREFVEVHGMELEAVAGGRDDDDS